MKTTGIVRRVDDLGRIVLPKELRRTMDIDERDSLEIFVDGAFIMLRKHEVSCVFCGSVQEIRNVSGKSVCGVCIDKIAEMSTGQ